MAVEDGVGYLVGAGYDMKFDTNLIAGAEVLYHVFNDDALNVEVTNDETACRLQFLKKANMQQ
ncbi:hypothetical protein [Yoonia sp.]|uniref:hypothetical protein n=1 Tax=Yoonia sp. TaxID=2212373 RepID=UPI00397542A7